MELKKWKASHEPKDFLNDLFDIRSRMNDLFDTSLSNFFGDTPARTRGYAPEVDIVENDNEFVIHADLPGINPKEVHLDVRGNTLTISGERKEEREKKDKNYYRAERYFGSFQRSFTLPEGIDQNKISAQYKNGVLNVTIPKGEASRPKQIEINVEEHK